jgi:hypothetical protein
MFLKFNKLQEMYGQLWRCIRSMVKAHRNTLIEEFAEMKLYGFDYFSPFAPP